MNRPQSKVDFYRHLVENKAFEIEKKKALGWIGAGATQAPVIKTAAAAEKAMQDTEDAIHRTIIGNTYYWMDHHDDVHLPGCFKKSINERLPKGLIWHLHDHLFEIEAEVGKFSNVYEKTVSWAELGVSKQGYTTCLCADSEIKRSDNAKIFEKYKSGRINQHSVGMWYIKIGLAVDDSDYKSEKALWDEIFPLLGNQDRAMDSGFFWAIHECGLREISCVLEGSNELTGTMDIEPQKQPAAATANKHSEFKDVLVELNKIYK